MEQTAATPRLSPVLIYLLKGVLDREQQPAVWEDLLQLQSQVKDQMALLGLELRLDEAEGYAYLKQVLTEEGENSLPRLIPRYPLSYPVSLLCVMLRKKLVESDAGGAETRVILTHEQLVDMMRVFLQDQANEAAVMDQIDRHINKTVEIGFLRALKTEPTAYEVRRLVKALVDADWLVSLDEKLKAYKDHGNARV